MKEHWLTLRPRYDETDRMGVVHHRNYLSYFEMGRTEMLRSFGSPYSEMERAGSLLVVTSLGANYRASAAYDEEIRVRTRVTHLGPVTVRFDYIVEAFAGKLLVDGFTELACVGTNLRPRRLPAEIVALLRPLVQES